MVNSLQSYIVQKKGIDVARIFVNGNGSYCPVATTKPNQLVNKNAGYNAINVMKITCVY